MSAILREYIEYEGRVYYFFGKSNERKTVTPGPLMHGKHTKKVWMNVASKKSHKQVPQSGISLLPRKYQEGILGSGVEFVPNVSTLRDRIGKSIEIQRLPEHIQL